MLRIILDPVFQPYDTSVRSKENCFELIFCPAGSKFNLCLPLNTRQDFNVNLYPLISNPIVKNDTLEQVL